MGRSAYTWRKCHFCGEEHSSNGLASTSHARKHVRDGDMTERTYYIGKEMYRSFEMTEQGRANRKARLQSPEGGQTHVADKGGGGE